MPKAILLPKAANAAAAYPGRMLEPPTCHPMVQLPASTLEAADAIGPMPEDSEIKLACSARRDWNVKPGFDCGSYVKKTLVEMVTPWSSLLSRAAPSKPKKKRVSKVKKCERDREPAAQGL